MSKVTKFTPTHIGQKLISCTPMTRKEYNDFRGWSLPENEADMGDDDGYMVEYEPHPNNKANVDGYDGYISWSPKDVFNAAYKSLDNMSFGDALTMLKRGSKVARKGWNGKGLSLKLITPSVDSEMTLPFICMQYPATPASDSAPASHINAKVPWLASQTDMLAEDWVLIGDVS
jgi:hypothetical protein